MAKRFIRPIPLEKLPCSLATGSMQMLGDTAFHRDRYATLSGY